MLYCVVVRKTPLEVKNEMTEDMFYGCFKDVMLKMGVDERWSLVH